MSETLLSVGIDIGTSTTQLVFSRLHLNNRANAFSVPDIRIAEKEILYRSEIHFTPLLTSDRIDASGIRGIVDREYQAFGIEKSEIQTGAIIITGETARKENAAEVAQELSGYAGDFVVATAGPDLESELAARGAGAEQWAREHRSALIHIDIGGGTSNFAVFEEGRLTDTGCVNVGGRLLRLSPERKVLWRSPVLNGLCKLDVGDIATEEQLNAVADLLTCALEEAVGNRPPTALSKQLTTNRLPKLPAGNAVISFSGGVGALLEQADAMPPLAYGDLGIVLARRIRNSSLMKGAYRICPDAIRATVIGAGCHATSLSGSTIFYQNVAFPMQGLPVVCFTQAQSNAAPQGICDAIVRQREKQEETIPVVLSFCLPEAPSFADICRLADGIALAATKMPVITVTQSDCAKALGQALACRLRTDQPIVCLDALHLRPGSYLDIGNPVANGEALPVVIKTLIFSS